MAFTHYYVHANYLPRHQHGSVVGFGKVCDSLKEAQSVAASYENNLKVDWVAIQERKYGI